MELEASKNQNPVPEDVEDALFSTVLRVVEMEKSLEAESNKTLVFLSENYIQILILSIFLNKHKFFEIIYYKLNLCFLFIL